MAYSIDLREKVIAALQSGMTQQDVSELFEIGTTTIKRWKKLLEATDSLEDAKRDINTYERKISNEELEEFAQFLDKNSDLTQQELADVKAYAETELSKSLRREDIIVMDNASFHKGSEFADLVKKAGARIIFLPTYSPDLNLIEELWSQLKALKRKEKIC
jgi:transposase